MFMYSLFSSKKATPQAVDAIRSSRRALVLAGTVLLTVILSPFFRPLFVKAQTNLPPVAITFNAVQQTADYGSSKNIRLSWTRSPESDWASYKIYRSTSPNVTPTSTLVTTISSGTSGYDASGNTAYGQNVVRYDTSVSATVAPGTTYYFKIFVVDSVNQQTGSDEQSFVALNAAPTAVTLNPITQLTDYDSSKFVRLTWTKGVENDFASYKIYRATTPNVTNTSTLVATIVTGSSGYDAAGAYTYGQNITRYDVGVPATAAPGTTHYFKVFVEDSAGQQAASNEQNFLATNAAPTALTLNPVTQLTDYGSSKNVRLSWTKGVEPDFASYKIYRAMTAGVTATGTPITTLTPSSSGYDAVGASVTGQNITRFDTTVPATAPPGTTYYFKIFLFDSAGQNIGSNEQNFIASNAAPSAVTLSPITQLTDYGSSKGIRLAWTKGVENDFASYKIYRATTPNVTSATGTLVTTLTSSNSGYDANGASVYGQNITRYDTSVPATAPPGTTYYFKIFVEDSAGQQAASNEESFLASNSAPTAITLNPVTQTSDSGSSRGIRLTWTKGTENDFASYKIYRATTPNVTATGTPFVQLTTSSSGYDSTGNNVYGQNITRYDTTIPATAPPGTTYYFRIFLFDSAGQNVGSNEESFTASNAAPIAITLNPIIQTSDSGNNKGVRLSWTRSAEPDFASYKIYRATTPNVTNTATLVTTITTGTSGYDANGASVYGQNVVRYDTTVPATAPPGTTHYFKVFVEDSAGQQAASNEESFLATNAAPTALTLNPITQLTDYGNSKSVRLTWTKGVENDFTSYKIYRATTPNVAATGTPVVTLTTSSYGYDVNGASVMGQNITRYDTSIPAATSPGTTHYFKIFLFDSAGQNIGSNEESFTATNAGPTAITLNPVTQISDSGNSRGVRLSWTKGTETDFASYKIYRATAPNVTSTTGTLVTTLSPSSYGYDAAGNSVMGQNIVRYDTSVSATVPPGTTYYFRIFLVDSAGQEAGSNEESFTATNVAPEAVTLNPITQVSSTGATINVRLNWTKSAELDWASYKIYRAAAPGVTEASTLVTTLTSGSYGYDANGASANGRNIVRYDTGVTATVSPGTTYYFKVFVFDSAGQKIGSNEQSFIAVDLPGVPGPPTFGTVTYHSIQVIAPALPYKGVTLTLQAKTADQNDLAFNDVATGLLGGATTDVDYLSPSTVYAFRYVSITADGTRTAGESRERETLPAPPPPVTAWTPGQGIDCGGIRWPFDGATIQPGARAQLSAFLATDWDEKQVTYDGATTATTYSDPCSYTWSANGGSVADDENTGQSIEWIAPSTPGTYTITLTVDDRNSSNQANGEIGSRDDDDQGYNDVPQKFSVTVTVAP